MKSKLVERLSNLKFMRMEMDLLTKDIAELHHRASGKKSSWLSHCRTPEELNEIQHNIDVLTERMRCRIFQCAREREILSAFIDSIQDNRMRVIMTLRYVNGLTWLQIAFKIDYYDEQRPRHLHDAFIRRLERDGVPPCLENILNGQPAESEKQRKASGI